jgi:tetratricopeptide (TPR) repeat protein
MAEGGLIDKLIGNDELEAPDSAEVIESTVDADTVATIVAMDSARFDPNLSHRAAEYLDSQRELTVLTIKHFDHERVLALEQSKLSILAAKRKAISDRLRIALQIVLAFIPLFLVAGIAFLVYGAVTSRSVVVDAFQAPAALAPSGITGEVVASGVLDELQKLQNATRSVGLLSTRSAWSSDVKIEVPETGVSIGEIDRLLRLHLGRDIHIDGDLIQSPTGGLQLTVRGEGVPPQTFSGGAADLNKLTAQAAEYIYGRSQPYEYLMYLQDQNRLPEAVEFANGAYLRASDDVLRSQLANQWGNALAGLNKPAESAEKYRLAIALQPFYWAPRSNLVSAIAATEGEEAAWRESRAFLQAAAAAPKKQQPRLSVLSNPAQMTWDLPLLLASLLDDSSRNNGAGAVSITDQPLIAIAYAMLHDPAEATRYLSLSDPSAPETQEVALIIPVLQATATNNPSAAAGNADAFWKLWLANPQLQVGDDNPCIAALSLGMAGNTTESDAIFQRLGPWSRCTAAHGQILEHQGNLAAAQAMWAGGIRTAPDLPFVYMARGLSEINRGDLHAAEADLRKASANAPHFADPLKDYGDLLAREGRWEAALAKYDQALKYAPAWQALQQARDQAASHR